MKLSWATALAIAASLVLSLAACGAGQVNGGFGAKATAGSASPEYDYASEAAPQAVAGESWADQEDAMVVDAGSGAGMTSMGGGGVADGRKLTYRASYGINTKRFDADYAEIDRLVTEAGGYIESESTMDYSYPRSDSGRTSDFSVRVPAKGYGAFLDALGGVGEVFSKDRSTEDLTSQYFDTEARIEMLELRKERLMGYLVEAESAADIVEYERELASVLYDLDQYQGQKRGLDKLIDYATIDIHLVELITPETIGKDGEPLGERAQNAFALSANGVWTFLRSAAVGLAAAVPVILLFVVLALIAWAAYRVSRKIKGMMNERKGKGMMNERKGKKDNGVE